MKSQRQAEREAIQEHGRRAVGPRGMGYVEPRHDITLADHRERAQQGSEKVTRWCPTCRERAVPMRDGTCGFCATQIVTLDNPEPASAPEPNGLRMGENLLLPLDAATQSLAILAVKGAGKSNAAAVLAEEMFDEGIPWLVVDPKGDWWGIRESVEDAKGLPLLVLGGLHGDLPLSPAAGRQVADLIVERNLTCVLDISAMDDEERPEFLEDVGTRLFELHRVSPTVRHIFVEEANEVVPESRAKDVRGMLKAWRRIVCQGRQRGLGITLISQRSAMVSKDVLTQTGSLIVLRTTSPQDRQVIRGWTDFHSVGRELVDSLPSLANGEAWIVAPSWLGRVERVRVRRRWTFDSGATPEVISSRRPQLLDSVDIEEIGRTLAGEPPRPTEAADEQEFAEIEDVLSRAPATRSELLEATGLAPSTLYRQLTDLAQQGLAHVTGRGRGALWALGAGLPAPEEPEPESEPESEPAETPSVTESARRFLAATGEAHDALADLDAILDEARDGLTMLRARYLAALLKRIEAGDSSEALLDRFERVAGIQGA